MDLMGSLIQSPEGFASLYPEHCARKGVFPQLDPVLLIAQQLLEQWKSSLFQCRGF